MVGRPAKHGSAIIVIIITIAIIIVIIIAFIIGNMRIGARRGDWGREEECKGKDNLENCFRIV
jgi:hypothetical protein